MKSQIFQFIKFALFSISAGAIQIGTFAIFMELFHWTYWLSYLVSLTLSVLWNFTFNRRFTFKAAVNIPLAMAQLFGFYVVFTPVSTYLGHLVVNLGVNEYIVEFLTMTCNFVLEFLFCKFVMYRNRENTLESKKR